ncbi:MAG: LEPR-XLL domain-containing protein [Alphaproteobacteria bacterium]|nr:LEPR-XLL domain-containing protein [Alphaproteobacteria bacterium]
MAFPFGQSSFEPPKVSRFRSLPLLPWMARQTPHRFFFRKRKPLTKAERPVRVSAIKLESLEPRYLLSADLMPLSVDMAGIDGASYTLSFDDLAQTFRIYDDETGGVVDQRAVAETSEVMIRGTEGNDRLTLDVTAAILDLMISFDGAGGDDVVAGPAADALWTIDGHNSGSVANLSFTNVESVEGQADNEDTFVVGAAGVLDGVIDGGAGGFDSMVLDGGSFDSVVYTATGPNSGSINRDGVTLVYDGLEPLYDQTGTNDLVIDLTAISDEATVFQDGGNVRVESTDGTFESVIAALPTSSLTINLGDDLGLIPANGDELDVPIISQINGDVLTVGTLDLGAAAFTVNGEDGADRVVFTGTLSAGAVTVNAEDIEVAGGASVTGTSVSFNAAATADSLTVDPTMLVPGVFVALPVSEILVKAM